jgi:nitroreductase
MNAMIKSVTNIGAAASGEQQFGFDEIVEDRTIKLSEVRQLQPRESVKQQHTFGQIAQEPLTESITGNLSVSQAIRRRRSVGQVTQQEPTRAQIERILEAATYAPSHQVTEPWHFIVLTGPTREEFGNLLATVLSFRLEDRFSEKARIQLARERMKALRAPVIITVAMKVQGLKGILTENIAAAGAAVQNMLLTAEEMRLATIWRTGDAAYDPLVKRWFGLSSEDLIMGFVYVGYPKVSRPERVPTHFSTRTIWPS